MKRRSKKPRFYQVKKNGKYVGGLFQNKHDAIRLAMIHGGRSAGIVIEEAIGGKPFKPLG